MARGSPTRTVAARHDWVSEEPEALKHLGVPKGSIATQTILIAISKLEDKLDALLCFSTKASDPATPSTAAPSTPPSTKYPESKQRDGAESVADVFLLSQLHGHDQQDMRPLDTLCEVGTKEFHAELPLGRSKRQSSWPLQGDGGHMHIVTIARRSRGTLVGDHIDNMDWLVPRADTRDHGVLPRISGPVLDMSIKSEKRESAIICRSAVVNVLKIWWDVLAILLLVFDAVTVPYLLAWHVGGSRMSSISLRVSIGFWSLDMVFNFLIPYESKRGLYITNCRKIAKHYMKRGFVLDCCMLGIDFVILISTMTHLRDHQASWLKAARFFKVIRCARALQRLQGDSFKAWLEYAKVKAARFGLETSLSFCIGSALYVLFFVWLIHVGSCVWWILVKSTDRSLDLSWSKDLRTEFGEDLFENQDYMGYMYLKGCYFTLISIVSCSSPLTTNTSEEMALSLGIALSGWILGCVFLSNLAAALVEFKTSKREREHSGYQLRQYLRQHQVPAALAVSIRGQVQRRASMKTHVCKKDVLALRTVSPQLLRLLDIRVHEPHFASEPLLGALHGASKMFLPTLCLCENAFSVSSVEPGSLIFDFDQECERALFVINGDMLYTGRSVDVPAETEVRSSSPSTFDSEGSLDTGIGTVSLQPGTWVASACLCLHWQTQGSLESSTHGEMLSLRASGLWEVMRKFHVISDVVVEYGKVLAEVLRGMGSAALNDVVTYDENVKSSVLCRLPDQHRRYLSFHVLDVMKKDTKGKFSSKCIRELEHEVNLCQSSLILVNGAPERLVFLAVVNLQWKGEHLAQVGVVSDDGGFENSKPQYPAAKRNMNETSEAAAARMVQQTFSCLRSGPLILGRESRETIASAKFALPSRYTKLTFDAEVDGDCESSWADVIGHLVMESSRPIKLLVTRSSFETARDQRKPRKVYAWLTVHEWMTLEAPQIVESTFVRQDELLRHEVRDALDVESVVHRARC